MSLSEKPICFPDPNALDSIFDRNKPLTLRHQGKSLREIATELGIGKDTVRAAFAY